MDKLKKDLNDLIAQRKAKIEGIDFNLKHFRYYHFGKIYKTLDDVKEGVLNGEVKEKDYLSVKKYYEEDLINKKKKINHEIDILNGWLKEEEDKEND